MPLTSMSFMPIMNTIAESTAFGRKLSGRVRKRSTIDTTAAVVRWASWLPMIEETDLWQTGGDLISAKSGSAVRRSLGGLVEEPDAWRRKTVLALEENRYAHGCTQL